MKWDWFILDQSMTTNGVAEFYKGKGVFITGATGFIGKVIVEKFLWSLPDVEKLYILVRKKKGKTPQERLKADILDSPIMNRLKERHGKGFLEWAFSKIEGVVGDVSADQEFISPEVQKKICDKVHVIIHSAATIGFFEKLNDAFNLNTLGSLRMIDFARRCPNFVSFVQISTCYVNSPMIGKTIEEKVYPLKIPDWDGTHEEFIQHVLKQSPEEIVKITEKILSKTKHPNTYTFTKSCTEQILMKRRENFSIAICRPSIVGGALKEPYPGWVDAVGAAGGIYISAGLGISHIVPGDPKAITDQIPVDLVVNGCILAGAYIAGKKEVEVFHLGTSCRNPVTWGVAEDGVLRYWHGHVPKSAISEADLQIIKSDFIYKTKFFLMYSAVARAYDLFSRVIPTAKNKENAKMLAKVEQRVVFLNDNFKLFMSYEWIFDQRNMEMIESNFTKQDCKIFFTNPREIDWSSYFQYFCYGLHKWIIKEDPNPPSILKSDLVKQSTARMFSDVTFAMELDGSFRGDEVMRTKTRDQVKELILSSKRVQDAIQKEAEKKSTKFVEVEDKAKEIMNTMLANPKAPAVRLFAWYLRKIWRTLYTSIIVDDFEIERIKALHLDRSNGPMIIIPTHRSYVDFLITSYIFLAYKIPLPHIAAGEDFLNMSMVQTLFRYSGAFFIRRTFNEDPLYKSIFVEYVQQLLMDHASIEFFTEGTRSREGKTLQPKLGLLSVIVETFFEKKIPNLTILPLNISYERYLQISLIRNI
jgi:1-acyl-sn-glycerol-3-phosphate acyltransferase